TEDLHLTVKGRRVELEEQASGNRATGQFEIDDKRPVEEIAQLMKSQGFDPIWKDWDPAILATT
ncbi:MAG: 2-iminoacetate synthase, partial [Akkermansiaceae bacterium]